MLAPSATGDLEHTDVDRAGPRPSPFLVPRAEFSGLGPFPPSTCPQLALGYTFPLQRPDYAPPSGLNLLSASMAQGAPRTVGQVQGPAPGQVEQTYAMREQREQSGMSYSGPQRTSSEDYSANRRRSKVPKQVINDAFWLCKVCSQEVRPSKMREHVAAHLIVQVDAGSIDPQTCGFCGTAENKCEVTLEQGSAKGILVPFSSCDYFYKFNLKSASKDTSPCTNVPLQCPFCPSGIYFWKYNMQRHLSEKHPGQAVPGHVREELLISHHERDRLGRKNVDYE